MCLEGWLWYSKIPSIDNLNSIIDSKLPVLDILVAARDEENVIERLVERLFNLDYPTN